MSPPRSPWPRAAAIRSRRAPLRQGVPCSRRTGAPAAGGKIAVSLITKDSTNPFFVAMQAGAKKAGTTAGVDITIASGKAEGDDQGQIDAIENAIAAKQKGILITPMSTGVNDAIKKARDAGLYVIALDTPTDPPDAVDITFATDNREAGKLIGQYTAAKLDGKKAVIALLDIFNDKIVSVDYNRDQGFLEGMGIDVGDPKKNGDEAKTGKYTGGKGGDYEIVGNEATGANEEGGQKGMENLLAKNKDINVDLHDQRANRQRCLRRADRCRQDDCGLHPRLGRRRQGRRAGSRRRPHRGDVAAVPAEDGRPRRSGHRRLRQQRHEATGQRRSRLLQHRCHA